MKLTEREYKALIADAAKRLADFAPNIMVDGDDMRALHQRIGEIIDEGFPKATRDRGEGSSLLPRDWPPQLPDFDLTN